MKPNYFTFHKNKNPKPILKVNNSPSLLLKRRKIALSVVTGAIGAAQLHTMPLYGAYKEDINLAMTKSLANTAIAVLKDLEYNPYETLKVTGKYGRKPKGHIPIDSLGVKEALEKLKYNQPCY